MKKHTTILRILCSSILLTAFAEATPMEKATELMKIMGVTSQIDTTQRQMNSFIDRVVNSQGLAEEKAKLAKSLVKKSMASSLEAIKSIDWEEKFAKIYAAEFTTEELQGLIDFYKSPIGKKFLEKQPQLMAATMGKMSGEIEKLWPKINSEAMNVIFEVKKYEGPLKIKADAMWTIKYDGDNKYSLTRARKKEDDDLDLRKLTDGVGPEGIPALMERSADLYIKMTKGMTQKEYKKEKIDGTTFTGEFAKFKLVNGSTQTIFMVSDGDGIWRGGYTGTKEGWDASLKIIEQLERKIP